jgi:hypothetical protein
MQRWGMQCDENKKQKTKGDRAKRRQEAAWETKIWEILWILQGIKCLGRNAQKVAGQKMKKTREKYKAFFSDIVLQLVQHASLLA